MAAHLKRTGHSPAATRSFSGLRLSPTDEKDSKKLAETTQVVVLTKADLPHVAARAEATLAALREAVPHSRILCISAESGANLTL